MAVRFQRITWPDPGYGNTIDFEYPGHRPMPKTEWIGERADAPSGAVDTWKEAEHAELELEFRRIPPQDKTGATGYHGATGIAAFRLYALDGGVFTLRIDRDDVLTEHSCQLVQEELRREEDKAQAYRWSVKVRDVNGTEFEV